MKPVLLVALMRPPKPTWTFSTMCWALFCDRTLAPRSWISHRFSSPVSSCIHSVSIMRETGFLGALVAPQPTTARTLSSKLPAKLRQRSRQERKRTTASHQKDLGASLVPREAFRQPRQVDISTRVPRIPTPHSRQAQCPGVARHEMAVEGY